ncbi:hypothetical protein ACQ86O_20680 [Serratia sp. L9]|uniref:hypothetical protein n=1 Tax=Serratia sp. L9 TaxID=3423946 RepID=UPI003D6704A9
MIGLLGKCFYSKSSDFESLYEWASYPARYKILEAGEYTIDKTLNIVGSEILFEGLVTLNVTKQINAIKIGVNSLTEVCTLNEAIQRGSTKIKGSFVNIHNGDLLAIWNPQDYSYSSFREYYRQGEFAVVGKVSSDMISLDGGIIDSYPNGSKVYKIETTNDIRMSGKIEINYPKDNSSAGYSANSIGLLLSQLRRAVITGLSISASNAAYCVLAKKCFSLTGENVEFKQQTDAPSTSLGLDYAFAVSNCQHIRIDGRFSAERHAVTHGGNAEPASIVNRFCHFSGEFLTTGKGSVGAADWHGNTEMCSFSGYAQGSIAGGFRNKFSGFLDSIPNVPDWPLLLGSECKGMDFDYSNVRITSAGNPRVSNRGVIDFGGNTLALGVDTVNSGVLNLSGCMIDAPFAEQVITIRNRGSKSPYWLDLSNTIVQGAVKSQAVRVIPVEGNSPVTINMTGFDLSAGMEIKTKADTNLIGLSLKTKVAAVLPKGQSSISVPILFDIAYPDKPKTLSFVQVEQSGSSDLTLFLTCPESLMDGNRLTVRIHTVGTDLPEDDILSVWMLEMGW